MLSLSWISGAWRYSNGVITIGTVEIPVGKCRKDAFYLFRVGEDAWKIAPVKFPFNHLEPYGPGFCEFVYLHGAPEEINNALSED
jgi:hypothetical protein